MSGLPGITSNYLVFWAGEVLSLIEKSSTSLNVLNSTLQMIG